MLTGKAKTLFDKWYCEKYCQGVCNSASSYEELKDWQKLEISDWFDKMPEVARIAFIIEFFDELIYKLDVYRVGKTFTNNYSDKDYDTRVEAQKHGINKVNNRINENENI